MSPPGFGGFFEFFYFYVKIYDGCSHFRAVFFFFAFLLSTYLLLSGYNTPYHA